MHLYFVIVLLYYCYHRYCCVYFYVNLGNTCVLVCVFEEAELKRNEVLFSHYISKRSVIVVHCKNELELFLKKEERERRKT